MVLLQLSAAFADQWLAARPHVFALCACVRVYRSHDCADRLVSVCRHQRGPADGLQQDFKVLQAESVTASGIPTPPSQHNHRATTPYKGVIARRVTLSDQRDMPGACGNKQQQQHL
jgi:hypothetical protein